MAFLLLYEEMLSVTDRFISLKAFLFLLFFYLLAGFLTAQFLTKLSFMKPLL